MRSLYGHRGRGFTLLEVALASVMGGLMLIACLSLFRAMSTSDRFQSTRAARIHEMALAQVALRRGMLGIVMGSATAPCVTREGEAERLLELQIEAFEQANERTTGEDEDESAGEPASLDGGDILTEQEVREQEIADATEIDEPERILRERIVLEFENTASLRAMAEAALFDRDDGVPLPDPNTRGALVTDPQIGRIPRLPQRLEMLFADRLISETFAEASAWARQRPEELQDLFLNSGGALEGEQGFRACFDLRPDFSRERVMRGMGTASLRELRENGLLDELRAGEVEIPGLGREPTGWTLWFRPVYAEEVIARIQGQGFDIDTRPDLLQGAVPMIRGLRVARWTMHAGLAGADGIERLQRLPTYRGLCEEDIPGFIELELETVDGVYHSWIFELAWVVDDEEQSGGGPGGDGEDGAGQSSGSGSGSDGGDGQGGSSGGGSGGQTGSSGSNSGRDDGGNQGSGGGSQSGGRGGQTGGGTSGGGQGGGGL